MSEDSRLSLNRSAYDRWSAFYDVYPNPTVAMDELHFPQLWSELSHKQVLEIGCGTGRHTSKLLRQGNTVVAVDLSPGMLAQAKEKLGEASAQWIEGDFLSLEGLGESRFDAVIAALVLEHIADLDRFFARVALVMRVGGACYLSEIHPARTAEGVLAHFREPGSREEIQLGSTAHRADAIAAAAQSSGLRVEETLEFRGDEALARLNPKWERHLGAPMIQVWRIGAKAP